MTLIEIFEESVKRHGKDYPLTIGHLLNILKLQQKQEREWQQQLDTEYEKDRLWD